jgi:tetrahydromethanopterin S-methyltransferase subunit C
MIASLKNQGNARAASLYCGVRCVLISFANFIDLSKSESVSVMYPIDSAMIAFKENIT